MAPIPRSEILRQAVGTPCPYCGQEMNFDHHRRYPTRDHIKPRVHGGHLKPASDGEHPNRLVVCYGCNSDKGSRTLAAFALWLFDSHDPRAVRVIDLWLARRPPEIQAGEHPQQDGAGP